MVASARTLRVLWLEAQFLLLTLDFCSRTSKEQRGELVRHAASREVLHIPPSQGASNRSSPHQASRLHDKAMGNSWRFEYPAFDLGG